MQIERLEQRTFLSFTPYGADTPLPFTSEPHTLALATAENGSYLVAAVTTDSSPLLKAVRYSSSGVQIGAPLTLDTISPNMTAPQITASMDADGDAVIAYRRSLQDVYTIRISKDGVISAPQQVTAETGENQVSQPAVSMDSAGGYFVAWTRYIDTGHDDTVHIRAYDAAGNARAAEFTVGGASSLDFFGNPIIAAKRDGSGAIVAFRKSGEAASAMNYAIVSASSLVGQVQSITGGSPKDIAPHADGSFVIGYEQVPFNSGPEELSNGVAQRFDAAGSLQGDPIELGDTLPGVDITKKLHGISVAAMPDGGFAVTFIQTRDGVDTVYARRYTAAGAADSSGLIPINAQPAPTSQFSIASPIIRADASGLAQVAFLNQAGQLINIRRLTTTDEIALVQNGILYVLGTSGSDAISVDADASTILVTRGTATKNFDATGVNVIDIDALGGDDSITNDTSLKATLRGGAGSDTIFGGTGEDRLHGGIGNDALWGGDSADKIYGEDGVDSLYGNGGNDRIEGGAQHDHIRGNGGKDLLFGNGGNDQIYGGSSADRIYGQAGSDLLWGEGGNDRLYGDDGGQTIDTLHGGPGNDVLICVDASPDQAHGDSGRDTANADFNDTLTSIEA